MKCAKCNKIINNLNHFYVPGKKGKGERFCLKCAREANIITLV